jgi:hypothetical protein
MGRGTRQNQTQLQCCKDIFASIPTFDFSQVKGHVVVVDPMTACDNITNKLELSGKIAIIRRGPTLPEYSCSFFIAKARVVEKLGAIGGIIIGSNVIQSSPLLANLTKKMNSSMTRLTAIPYSS